MSRDESRQITPRLFRLRPGVLLTAGLFLALTLFGWQLVRGLERESIEERFSARIAEVELRLKSRLTDYEEALRSAAALMLASDAVSREEWRTFARGLQLVDRYPGVQGLGYAQRLQPHEVQAHIDAVRREGLADYRLWPAGQRDEYTAIVYLEPDNARTRGALGYDMFADPVRRQAMSEARDQGAAVISPKVALLRDNGDDSQPGLLMYLPHYAKGLASDTVEGRRAALRGYIYAPIRFREFVAAALQEHAADFELEIYDGRNPVAEALLYRSHAPGAPPRTGEPLFRRTVTAMFHGQNWTLRAASLPGIEQQVGTRAPAAVLWGGLLVTLLATMAALAASVSRERANALSAARGETQRILESIDDAFFALDGDWRFTYLNPQAEKLLHRGIGELLNRNIWEEFPQAVGSEFHRQYRLAREQQKSVSFIEFYPPLRTWFEVHAYPQPSGLSVFFRNINQRRAREEALRLRERALEASANAIVITDHQQPDQPIIYVNPAFERITGYRADEAVGRNCRFLQGSDRNQADIEKLRALIRDGEEGRVVLRNYHKSGDLFWNELYVAPVRDEQGRITHFVGVQTDITDSKKYLLELERRATHDLLTGLANRSLLMDRIQLAAMQARRRGSKVAVLFIDLDGFKMINDGFGHGTGDQVLKLTGNRLAANIRQGDTAARLGGDEFVVVLNDQEKIEDISDAVQRIMDAVLRPIPIQQQEITLTCSIGISVCPDDGDDPDELLKFADVAMYKAKEEGKNTSRFYTRGMNDAIVRKVTLTNNLRRALEREEFRLHYQPQIDLATGAPIGAEALIRWQHPQYGMVSPAQFIPLAEQSGQIVQVGGWALLTACRQAAEFAESGLAPLVMSVNLSARQLRDDNLIQVIRNALLESGLPPASLELEITESMVMSDVEKSAEILARIKKLGVRIAMDDFGTGYSSLSYLKRFPIDRLKIDQSFIHEVTTDPSDAALTRAIIALAHNLGIRVVAEGVETREQRDFLVKAGCDEAQGFFYGRPVPAAEFRELAGRLQAR
ncbi:MAG: EAL domain-containing protein [Burkholderiales bacterium]|jgi:diguanylate cyclase (GGDEF)-like protein/PAS domain S-box-containing protein|nr:EAL domain-containing protein [Burkholderiales bacterium]